MFLGGTLAERERTGQSFRSKQALSCPVFFQSIPVLNALSDPSKPVQRFSHAVFHRFLSVFSLFWLSNLFKKIVRRLNYIIFDRDLTILCQNPFNALLRLCFSLSRGRFFPVKYLSSQACQSTMVEQVWTQKTCLSGVATLLDYHHLNAILRVRFCCNAWTKYCQLSNT